MEKPDLARVEANVLCSLCNIVLVVNKVKGLWRLALFVPLIYYGILAALSEGAIASVKSVPEFTLFRWFHH